MIKEFFEKRRLASDWRLVHTHEESWVWKDAFDDELGTSRLYFYHFENGVGERKVESNTAGYRPKSRANCEKMIPDSKWYRQTAYPWLKGRYIAEINSYESIKHSEVMDKLEAEQG